MTPLYLNNIEIRTNPDDGQHYVYFSGKILKEFLHQVDHDQAAVLGKELLSLINDSLSQPPF